MKTTRMKMMMVLELRERERYLYYEVDNGGGIYIKNVQCSV